MHFEIAHRFGKAAAKARIVAAIADAKTKLAGQGQIEQQEWQGDTLHFAVSGQGQKISGTLEVTEEKFIVDATLPLMLRMFEGRIQKMIEERAGNLLK